MEFQGKKWNLLAASLNCVAATGSAEVRAVLSGIAPWMPNLMSCPTQDAFFAGVADTRPDIALVGPDFTQDDLAMLASCMRTGGMGLAVVGDGGADPTPRAQDEATHRIEIEPLADTATPAQTVIRLRALLRRCRPAALVQKHHVGAMCLDEEALTLTIGDRVAPLTLEGFRLVAPLFDDPDHVWTREELLPLVYGSSSTNGIRTVDVKLNVIRRRLRAALDLDPVQTVRGQGYTLAAPKV